LARQESRSGAYPRRTCALPGSNAYDWNVLNDSSDGLEAYDVLGLQTLGALLDFELNRLSFVEGLVPIGLNGRKVHENVLTGLALDESVALSRIEPLYCTLLSAHCWCS